MLFKLQKHLRILHKHIELLQPSLLYQPAHYYCKKMSDILQPPSEVRGMLNLDRSAFHKTVRVPILCVPESNSHKLLPILKKYFLKMERIKPVRPLNSENMLNMREILLNPLKVTAWDSLPTSKLEEFEIHRESFYYDTIELNFENWRADEILRSVLPPDDSFGSFSSIGHIVHVNLRDHLLDYKSLIGEVLLAKVPRCKTVVNKSATIDNTYRNFQFELIAGKDRYHVLTKENDTIFEFDFSRVYWNPRLSTEHLRIELLLEPGDVLYDVFAGVGPFAVPAARKKCTVYANDLNPDSYHWLKHNLKRYKCKSCQTFNKDGRDFILQDLRKDLINRWVTDKRPDYNIHITMNLPAMAVEFLDAFRGLLKDSEEIENIEWAHVNYPKVHVYCFTKDKCEKRTKEMARDLVEENLGSKLRDEQIQVHFVRNVAPSKDMYRVSFELTKELLMTDKGEQLHLDVVAADEKADVDVGAAAAGEEKVIASGGGVVDEKGAAESETAEVVDANDKSDAAVGNTEPADKDNEPPPPKVAKLLP